MIGGLMVEVDARRSLGAIHPPRWRKMVNLLSRSIQQLRGLAPSLDSPLDLFLARVCLFAHDGCSSPVIYPRSRPLWQPSSTFFVYSLAPLRGNKKGRKCEGQAGGCEFSRFGLLLQYHGQWGGSICIRLVICSTSTSPIPLTLLLTMATPLLPFFPPPPPPPPTSPPNRLLYG